jgi:hypothetical protein
MSVKNNKLRTLIFYEVNKLLQVLLGTNEEIPWSKSWYVVSFVGTAFILIILLLIYIFYNISYIYAFSCIMMEDLKKIIYHLLRIVFF